MLCDPSAAACTVFGIFPVLHLAETALSFDIFSDVKQPFSVFCACALNTVAHKGILCCLHTEQHFVIADIIKFSLF